MSLARATQDRPHEILRRPVARAGADNFWDWIGNFRDRSLRRVHCFGVATPTERTAGAASVDGLNRSATKLPSLAEISGRIGRCGKPPYVATPVA